MDKLQAIFHAEAIELISELERVLLGNEHVHDDQKLVQDIFRVMHTLKGSARMFGFDSLSDFTHDLETVYEEVRSGLRTITPELLDITLRSVDHLKNLTADPELKDQANRVTHQQLLGEVSRLPRTSGAATASNGMTGGPAAGMQSYYVQVVFDKSIFRNGTNPLFLIDDLAALGEALVLPRFQSVPVSEDFNPEECYAAFEIILYTSRNEQDIREVFIFSEDQVALVIRGLSEENLVNDPAFTGLVNSGPSGAVLGVDFVESILAGLSSKRSAAEAVVPRFEAASSIRVSSDKLDELMNLVSELVTSQARLSLIAGNNNIPALTNLAENFEKITRRLRDNAFGICLVPVETLVTRFQRLVRDLSRELHKELEFIAEGTETELDKSIIERITDPVLHILRNCIDHGIELPEERERNGKNRKGIIRLKAFHSGTNVIIEISDDGRGIDPEKIRSKAIKKGLITADEVLTEREITALIFQPGFSTVEKVTDVSGRGVGMDIVRQNIDAIHGDVTIDTAVGKGSTFRIRLPLTLSIMDGMLVQIAHSFYVLPLGIVEKCFEIPGHKIENRVVQKQVLDGNMLPVFNLRQAFGEVPNDDKVIQVIKIKNERFPVAITVDSIVGEYQAVMKPLGNSYKGQDEFSGATILGDGSVALVLDTDNLVTKCMSYAETVEL